jgi:hypothetical protein
MGKFRFTKTVAGPSLCGIAALTLLAGHARGQYDPNWARNFRIGMLAGFNIKADFRMGGTFNVSGSRPGPVDEPGADHFYDDGYVRVDDFDNAGGYTTFWGYENADQFQNNQLRFHSSSEFTTSSRRFEKDDSPFIGFDLAYGGNMWYWGRTRIGWELGFGLLPISISDERRLAATVHQSTYGFDVPDGVVLPDPPYSGGSSGFGQPSIFDTASLIGTADVPGTLSGSRTLDVILYAFRLGPTLFWDLNRHIGFAVGAGPAVGIISGNYEFDERLNTDSGTVRNRGQFGVSDVVFGGYVSGTITYHAVKNGDFYLSAQYMPMGTSTFRKGGREAQLNLEGAAYVSAGINWPF